MQKAERRYNGHFFFECEHNKDYNKQIKRRQMIMIIGAVGGCTGKFYMLIKLTGGTCNV